MATDTSVADVNRSLAVLAGGRFIGIDYATEEVLVRSFVRWDGGFGNRKRRPVITAAAAEVTSPALRTMLSGEFERLGLPRLEQDPGPVTESTRDSHIETNNQVDSLSNRASASDPDTECRSDRVVVTEVEYMGTATHNPQPIPPSAADNEPDPVDEKKAANIAAQGLTRAYTDLVPLSNFPAVMSIVKKARGTGRYDDEQLRAALVRLADDGRTVTTDALRYELEGFPAARPAPNRTDSNINSILRPAGAPTLRALPGGAS